MSNFHSTAQKIRAEMWTGNENARNFGRAGLHWLYNTNDRFQGWDFARKFVSSFAFREFYETKRILRLPKLSFRLARRLYLFRETFFSLSPTA